MVPSSASPQRRYPAILVLGIIWVRAETNDSQLAFLVLALIGKDRETAGDMFAGALLYGLTLGYAPAIAARGANFMCMNVITQVGDRLQQDAKALWEQGLKDHRADDFGG